MVMVFYMFPPLIGAPIHLFAILGNQALVCKRGEVKDLIVIVSDCSGAGSQRKLLIRPLFRPLPS